MVSRDFTEIDLSFSSFLNMFTSRPISVVTGTASISEFASWTSDLVHT